jgi:hypothetical protein
MASGYGFQLSEKDACMQPLVEHMVNQRQGAGYGAADLGQGQ